MSRLLARASLRHLLRHPWQSGLSILGIALGVAVVVAVDIANDSALRAFDLSVEQIAGRATHRIESATGRISDAVYAQLRERLHLTDASPVIESPIQVADTTLTLLGMDLLSYTRLRTAGRQPKIEGGSMARLLTTPGTLLLGRADAERLGIEPGDRVPARIGDTPLRVEVVGLLGANSESGLQGIAIADIATAQELTGRVGFMDRIDLVLAPDAATGLAGQLPPGLQLVPAGQRSETFRQMTHAFRINLTAMSLLALLVGGFIIYNSMTFAVLRRRPLLGALRTLGCTRGQLFALILGEAAVFALTGGLLGLGLGILTGWGLVQLVARTINDLYFAVTVSTLSLSAETLLKGVALGGLVTLAGALGPAVEAARSEPREVLRATSLERRGRRWVGWLAALGLTLVALGWAGALLPIRSLILGFAALMTLILGYSLCVPALLRTLADLLTPWVGRLLGLPALLAGRGIASSITRTGIATAALTIAIATTVGVGIMIDSFRGSLIRWLETTLRSDIYVTRASDTGTPGQPLPGGLAEALRRIDGIRDLSQGRRTEITTAQGRVNLLALQPSSVSARGFAVEKTRTADLWERFGRGEVLLASEPFAYHRRLAVGDPVRLFTEQGWVDIPIGGIFRDYGSDNGMLVLARHRYRELWGDDSVSSLGLVLKDGADARAVLDDVRRTVDAYDLPLLITPNAEIRRRSLTVFDQTFAITQVLRLLAIGVAFVGVLSALMALQLERRREYAIMRATGMTRGQLGLLVLTQTSMLGVAAGILAIPLGLIMGELLIRVINLRAFGWSMEMTVAPAPIVSGVLLAWLAACLAGLYPAISSARTEPAGALRAE